MKKYIIEFWSPWTAAWIPWAMQPVSLDEANAMADERRSEDPTITRRVVVV